MQDFTELIKTLVGIFGKTLAIILVFVGALMVAAYRKWDKLMSWVSNKTMSDEDRQAIENKIFLDGIEQTRVVYQLVADFQHMVDASRNLIIEFHNGGNMPSPRNKGYISVPYETQDSPIKPIRQDYQNFSGYDAHYIDMIRQITELGFYSIPDVHKMPECFLKPIYIDAGIRTVYIGRIKRVDTALVFFSIQWKELYDTTSTEFQSKYPVFVDKIIKSMRLDDPESFKNLTYHKRKTD